MRSPGPRLRHGVHAVRRDARVVQVGFEAPRRALLPAEPAVLDVLAGLRAGTVSVDDGDPTGAIAALAAADLLDPVAAPRDNAPPAPVRLSSPDDSDLVLLRRQLESLGVAVLAPGRTRTVAPALEVVVGHGPVAREHLDALLGEGVPHLVLAGTGRPGSLRLGPLVEPGVTACQRCVDAHEAEVDPRRPLVVAQLARLPAAPVDPGCRGLGLAWAARDVATYLAGGRPTTWSASVDLDVEVPVVREWRRHPWCGCAWDLTPY